MEWFALLVFGVLIVVSPGADFVLVLKNTHGLGRRTGILTAVGIMLGTFVHVSYSLIGLSQLIAESASLLLVIQYLGAAYLIYLGMTSLLSAEAMTPIGSEKVHKVRGWKAIQQGFFCNLLNPKTMLFFISVFSQLIGGEYSMVSVVGYGLYIAILHGVWFALLASVVSLSIKRFERHAKRISQICALALIGFGVSLSLQ